VKYYAGIFRVKSKLEDLQKSDSYNIWVFAGIESLIK